MKSGFFGYSAAFLLALVGAAPAYAFSIMGTGTRENMKMQGHVLRGLGVGAVLQEDFSSSPFASLVLGLRLEKTNVTATDSADNSNASFLMPGIEGGVDLSAIPMLMNIQLLASADFLMNGNTKISGDSEKANSFYRLGLDARFMFTLFPFVKIGPTVSYYTGSVGNSVTKSDVSDFEYGGALGIFL